MSFQKIYPGQTPTWKHVDELQKTLEGLETFLNYDKDDNSLVIGDYTGGHGIKWYGDSSTLDVRGIVSVTDTGSDLAWDKVSGSGKPQDLATWGAKWDENLLGVPLRFGDAAYAAGLYLTADYMGYWSGSTWPVYIAKDGKFYFSKDANNYVKYDGTDFEVKGRIVVTGGDVPWGNVSGATKPADNATVGANFGTGGGVTAGNAADLPFKFAASPSTTGLYLTPSYIGYYNATSAAWTSYISSSGTFSFGKDADNYVAYNGSAFAVKAGGGYTTIDANGPTVAVPENNYSETRAYRLTGESGAMLARLGAYWVGGADSASYVRLLVDYGSYNNLYLTADSALESTILLSAEAGAAENARLSLLSYGSPVNVSYVKAIIDATDIGVFGADGLAVTGHVTSTEHISATKAVSSGNTTPLRDYAGNIEADADSSAFGLFRARNRAYLGANIYRDGSTWKIDSGTGVYAYLTEVNEPGDIWEWMRSASGNGESTISTFTYPMKLTGSGDLTILAKFGCNGQSAQAAYSLDAAVTGTVDDTYGNEEHLVIDALVSQVNKIRAALVANGICA